MEIQPGADGNSDCARLECFAERVSSKMRDENRPAAPGVLKGVRVLDLSDVVAGPVATLYLAMLGAEIIKVENPRRGGDVNRRTAPVENGCSLRFCTLNHNKKSIAVDLATAEGKALVLRLAACSDIVVENFRHGVMERLGLGFEELKKVNPKIVYGSISGFGSTGPYCDRPAYDVIAQAMSGVAMMNGDEGGPPVKVGTSIGDVMAGMNLAIGVLAALREAERTGEAQRVEVALVDAMISALLMDHVKYLYNGELPVRTGNRYREWSPYGLYPAKDGYYALGVGSQLFYEVLVRDVLGCPELLEDERCASHNTRICYRELTEDRLNAWAAQRTVKEVCAALDAVGIPNAPVNSVREVAKDPHFAEARNMFPRYEQPEIGTVQVTNLPLRFPERGEVELTAAPAFGQQTEAVLEELLGMSGEQIGALKDAGVLF